MLVNVMSNSETNASKLEIVKESDSLYQAVVFNDNGEFIWGSEQGMTADELGRFLHDTYGFHQLDIFEKLSNSDPDRFFVSMDEELELAQRILSDHKKSSDYNEYLIGQLDAWVKRKKADISLD